MTARRTVYNWRNTIIMAVRQSDAGNPKLLFALARYLALADRSAWNLLAKQGDVKETEIMALLDLAIDKTG